jgi:hypothetical protein
MNRGKLLATMCVTALALGTAPAWAQRGSSSSGGGGTGSAVDRGSSSSSSPAPSSSSSSSGGSSSGGSSSGSGGGSSYEPASSSPSSSSGSNYVSVPVRPNQTEREQGRPRGGGSRSGEDSTSRAVPRGSDGTAGSPSSTERRTAGSGSADSPSRNAVPTYSRPRDGRQGTGTAVDRPAGYYGGGGSYPTYVYRYPGYYGSYFYPGYAFGLGYFYDPSWYDPYYYGGLYGGGYGGYYGAGDYGGVSGGGGGGYQGGTGSSSYGHGPQGSLRLKIKPREGQVFVDGFFVGTVDDFDGTFQKLGIDAGGHRIEIKAPGHDTVSFEVLITPNETVTYKGELPRIH